MIYCIPTDTCYWFASNIYNEEDFLNIYKLKWREFNNPLAFLLKEYNDISWVINLTDEQIEFLKNYPHPFTVIWDANKDFLLPSFLDKKIYSKIAVRVARECINIDLIKKLEYPSFLTSANYSWEKEIYSYNVALNIFWKQEGVMICSWITKNYPPSNIFSFVWDSLELNFLRKNY